MFIINKMLVQVFLNGYTMRILTRVSSATIPPIPKSVNRLAYILCSAFATSKKMNQAFLHVIKSMINFVSFACNRTGKPAVSLTYTQIWECGFLQLNDSTDLSNIYIYEQQ